MILKSHRLSNAFEHYFIPNSIKLLSPQNIKIELWDLSTRKIDTKFHPGLFCINCIAFSVDGLLFACLGGCEANISEIKIYRTSTLEGFCSFSLMEQVCNMVFSFDSNFIYIGTWEGNLYSYNIALEKLERILLIESSMIRSLGTDPKRSRLALAVSPKWTNRENWPKDNYVLIYNLASQGADEIRVPCVRPDLIDGLAITNNYLSCLVSKVDLFEIGREYQIASLYVYDLRTMEIVNQKIEFPVRDIHSDTSSMSWSDTEQLAYIGFREVFVSDARSGFTERSVSFDRPASVSFSNCGTAVAIGGDKAMLCKL